MRSTRSTRSMPRLFARCLFACGGLAVAALPAGAFAAPSASEGEPGITKPSQSFIPDARGNATEGLELAFPYPGPIAQVLVREGQVVKKGQKLIVQDTTVDMAALKTAEKRANQVKKVEAARRDLKAKQATLKRKEELHKKKVATLAELEEAQANADLAEIRIAVEQEEQAIAASEAEELRARMKFRTLVSPIDGVVSKIDAGAGKMADPSSPSIVIIKNDPLWVEVRLPTTTTKKMKLGEALQVRYSDETDWAAAKVIFLDPYADPTSQTRIVKLELANPNGYPAGLHVMVQAPTTEPAAEAAAAAAGGR